MARYAAVDIGSNSVRMMAADVVGDRTEILAQERQVTRLGESVFRSGKVSAEALTFLCGTLARMAGMYRGLSVMAVRAVATSAVRDAGNQKEFLDRTSDALGTKVEIISGPEEARLIHVGVEARWPRRNERTLIVDVGGGSAELILSENGELLDAVSKPLGAVRLTELFLKSDPPKPVELKRMRAYIDEKLLPFRRAYGETKPQRTIVTSATAAAIVSAIHQLPRAKRDEADRLCARNKQVAELYARLSQSDVATRRKMPGIGPRRAEIVVAGTAVFLRVLELFDLEFLYYCAGGVRDGIIADLAARGVGRELSRLSDQQRAVVREMAEHYHVNLKHAEHVAMLARSLVRHIATRPQITARSWKDPRKRGLLTRHWPLREQHRPPQAFGLSGGELRHAEFHRPRAPDHCRTVPLSPQVSAPDATCGVSGVRSGRQESHSESCADSAPRRFTRSRARPENP